MSFLTSGTLSIALLITGDPDRHIATSNCLEEAYKNARGGDFRPSDAQELRLLEDAFITTLQALSPTAELREQWSKLGFEASECATESSRLVIIREQADQKFGRGFYAFRPAGSPFVLEAPHVPTDEGTGDLVMRCFTESNAAAAAWNTVPRRYERSGLQVNADFARLTNTTFIAFNLAFARVHWGGRVVQFHGFEQGKRKVPNAAAADWILSSAVDQPPPALIDFAGQLRSRKMGQVLVYPIDTRDLGATQNPLSGILRAANFHNFLHVEISRSKRTELVTNEKLRRELLSCLAGGDR